MKNNLEKISAFFMGFVFSDALINFDMHPWLSGSTMLFLGITMIIMMIGSKKDEKDEIEELEG